MPKFITRIVALLLVPCLMTDSTLATLSQPQLLMGHPTTLLTSQRHLFQEEALAALSCVFPHPNTLNGKPTVELNRTLFAAGPAEVKEGPLNAATSSENDMVSELHAQPLRKIGNGWYKATFGSSNWVVKRDLSLREFSSLMVAVHLMELLHLDLHEDAYRPGGYFLNALRRGIWMCLSLVPEPILRRIGLFRHHQGMIQTHQEGEMIARYRMAASQDFSEIMPERIRIPSTKVRLATWPWVYRAQEVEHRADRTLQQVIASGDAAEIAKGVQELGDLQENLWRQGVYMQDIKWGNFGRDQGRLRILDAGSFMDNPAEITKYLERKPGDERVPQKLLSIRQTLSASLPGHPDLVNTLMEKVLKIFDLQNIRSHWPAPNDVRWDSADKPSHTIPEGKGSNSAAAPDKQENLTDLPASTVDAKKYMDDLPAEVIAIVQHTASLDELEIWVKEVLRAVTIGEQASAALLASIETIAYLFGLESKPDKGIEESLASVAKNYQLTEEERTRVHNLFYAADRYEGGEDWEDIAIRLSRLLNEVKPSAASFTIFDRIKQYKSLLLKLQELPGSAEVRPSADASLHADQIMDRALAHHEEIARDPIDRFDDILGFNFVIDDTNLNEAERSSVLTDYIGQVEVLLHQEAGLKVTTIRKKARVPGYEAANIFIQGLRKHREFGDLPIKIQFRFKTVLMGESIRYYTYRRYGVWEVPPWAQAIQLAPVLAFRQVQEALFAGFRRFVDSAPSEPFRIQDHLTPRPGWPFSVGPQPAAAPKPSAGKQGPDRLNGAA